MLGLIGSNILNSLWIITGLFVCAIFWMIVVHLLNQKKIDEYLENGDPVLFKKMGNNIEVAFQAPPGSYVQPYTLMTIDESKKTLSVEEISRDEVQNL